MEDTPVWKNVLNWFLERLKEPSTYVGFFNFLAVCGVLVKPELADLIKNLCIAIDALALFLVNENRAAVRELRHTTRRITTMNYELDSLQKQVDNLENRLRLSQDTDGKTEAKNIRRYRRK